ncbi:FAD-dependent oxidoreductase [Nesterenkonia alkaliphila]|uniref:FAD-dependent oxidoreductase n=1 Tax=Nesterenkonia alkaliphila TaxID=1463631 RepID=A0A7K1UHZ8_9MICC|nr:NAD(P)/FAD-dependent oxidoreductase [Nesterenkonia alkaliphila]MVT26012.1 FAD-dependent oxidoreductase [Nesterenkonia alkaliphila]GFZ86040.1 putative monooxygenase [Nesterenkonia alkaliphila]
MRTALICGGGVAGLSSALHLRKHGWEVRLFEKDSELRTAGVGLNIWPNGVRVLKGLGLGEEFLSFAAAMKRWWALDSDGTLTSDVDVSGWDQLLGAPITGARRRRLNAMLAEALGYDTIQFNTTAVSYEQDTDSVTVHFDDGTSATGDLLLGADGVGSKIRNHMLGGPPEFTDEGITRWRGVFATAEAGVPADVQADVYGAEGHFGWIPIDATHAYWYGSLGSLSTFEEFRGVYNTWTGTPVPKIIEVSEPESIIGRELTHYKNHLPRWADGRVTLLGDSAHPMYPGMAQGANQALIDGQVLAGKLDEHMEVPRALQAFEAERMHEANTMVEYSRLHFSWEKTRAEYRTAGSNLQIDRYMEFEV